MLTLLLVVSWSLSPCWEATLCSLDSHGALALGIRPPVPHHRSHRAPPERSLVTRARTPRGPAQVGRAVRAVLGLLCWHAGVVTI
jgi:hypothetical protein